VAARVGEVQGVKGQGPNGWPWRHPSYQDAWRWAPDVVKRGPVEPLVNETAAPAVVLYDSRGKPLTRKRIAGFVLEPAG
jgi:hypothetical protein